MATKIEADILYVTHRFHPHTGGVERHVYELSRRVAKKAEVAVLTADLKPGLSEFEEMDGVRVFRFPSISPGNAYYFCPQMYRVIKNSNCGIIHAHNYHALPAYIAFKARNRRIPFILTPHYHGKGSSRTRNTLFKLYDITARKAIKESDVLVCVSEHEKREIAHRYGVNPVVIPNGIDIEQIRKIDADCKSGDYVLYVGRLEKYKNVHVLIEAAKLGNFTLVIAGTGSYEEKLKRLARSYKLRVKFLGYVDEKEKIRLMKCCKVFANLSSIEAFGITALEALACGKPVIINRNSGLSELLKFKNVYGINPVPEEFVNVLGRIEPEKIKLRELRKYDWESIAREHLRMYKKL